MKPALIGEDGIALGEDFVHYSEVLSRERSDGCLALDLGRAILVLFIDPNDWLRVDGLLESRIAAGGIQRVDGESSDASPSTDEAGVDVIRGARARTDGAYRRAAMDRMSVLRVALDSDAEPSTRIAACTLLERADDGEERGALRASLLTTAHPQVRAAMAATIEGPTNMRIDDAPARDGDEQGR